MRRLRGESWSVVLAGGEGERTRPFIERWLGRHRPKQYCTFVGTRSLLQHTVDRADLVSRPSRRVTVVARSHAHDALSQLGGPGRVVFQPVNRGTAAGIFLPLSFVRAADPDATVVIYPSDHFVWPEFRFVQTIASAMAKSRACPERPILLGALPDRPETDYGWILTEPADGDAAPGAVRQVTSFAEKPGARDAAALMAAGGLWNTLITVARVDTLWQMGRRWLPGVIDRFDELHAHARSAYAVAALDAIYADMPHCDFSSGLLEPAAEQFVAMPLGHVSWSDWGRPQRIVDTLAAIGRTPAFAVERNPPEDERWSPAVYGGKAS